MIACKRLTLFLTGLLVLFACAAANAVVTTTTYGPFAVNCTGAVQLCNNTFSQTVSTAGTLQVQYNASAGHCSNVAAHILVDGGMSVGPRHSWDPDTPGLFEALAAMAAAS